MVWHPEVSDTGQLPHSGGLGLGGSVPGPGVGGAGVGGAGVGRGSVHTTSGSTSPPSTRHTHTAFFATHSQPVPSEARSHVSVMSMHAFGSAVEPSFAVRVHVFDLQTPKISLPARTVRQPTSTSSGDAGHDPHTAGGVGLGGAGVTGLGVGGAGVTGPGVGGAGVAGPGVGGAGVTGPGVGGAGVGPGDSQICATFGPSGSSSLSGTMHAQSAAGAHVQASESASHDPQESGSPLDSSMVHSSCVSVFMSQKPWLDGPHGMSGSLGHTPHDGEGGDGVENGGVGDGLLHSRSVVSSLVRPALQ